MASQAANGADDNVGRLQHAIDELSVLNEIVTAIGTHRKVDRINRLILAKCVRHFRVEQGVVHLINPAKPDDFLTTAVGMKTKARVVRAEDSVPLRLEVDLVGYIAKYKRPLVCNNFREDERFRHASAELPYIRSVLAVPLLVRNRVLGVLSLFNRVGDEPFEDSDQRLLTIIGMPASQVIENARLYEMEEGLRAARIVQQHFLPKTAPQVAGVDLDGFSLPALEVGGDYYDWLVLPDGCLGCIVADVSGKGMPAALLMAELQGAFRALAYSLRAPDRVLDAVNAFLGERMEPGRFVTLFYAIVDPAHNEMRYVNAGHNPPLLRRKNGSMEVLAEADLVLCPLSDKPYTAHRVPFEAGDGLVIYTDGITDAENSLGQRWGEENLRAALLDEDFTAATSVAARLKRELRDFVGANDQADDMTLAVVLRAAVTDRSA